MKRRQDEYALQVAVVNFLRIVLAPEALFFAVPNGEHRSAITGARLKRMGVLPGVADLMISWHDITNHVLWLELKAAKGRPTQSQVEFSYRALDAGHHWYIARSLAEVEAILQECAVPVRARIAA